VSTFYGITQDQVAQDAQAKFIALRAALNDLEDLYGWASGVAAADLEALGFSSADAGTLLAAINDANAFAQIYSAGLPPGSYPQPASAYAYAGTMRQVMGPA
jgi:hypothetical protein